MSNSPKKKINNDNNPQDLNNLICATCQKPGRYRCSGCHKVTYCGALCQKKHWPLHKDECLEIRKQTKSIEKKTQKQQRLSKKNIQNSPSPPKSSNIFKSSENSLNSFNFYEKIKNILLTNKNIDKVKIVYSIIPSHRSHLIKYILIKPGETVYFKWTSYLFDVYENIEAYIYNYCLLIKLLLQNSSENLKISNVLRVITREIFEGVLSYSLKQILDRCAERFRGKASEPIRYSRMILINYLKLVSFFIKISKVTYNGAFFIKFLNYYGFIFDIFLISFQGKKKISENTLKANLYFNIANAYVRETYLTKGISLYNQCIFFQKRDDIVNEILISCLYNLSVIYYVMDNEKQCEQCINEALELKAKDLQNLEYTSKYKTSQLQLLKLLIFKAEISIDSDNIESAVNYLKNAVELVKDVYSKRRVNANSIHQNYSRTNSTLPRKQYHKLGHQRTLKEKRNFNPLNNSLDNFETIRIDESNPKAINTKSTLYETLDKAMNKINGLFEKIMYIKAEKETLASPYSRYSSNVLTQSLNPKALPLRGSRYIPSRRISLNVGMSTPSVNTQTLLHPVYVSQITSDKVFSYLKESMQKKKKLIDKEYDVSDFKNFFLLLTKLSLHQIEILNETQSSNMPMSLYKNLPILFSKQFKNSLNPAQRIQLDKLKVLSLIRCRVLKDVNKPISLDNLKYEVFHTNISFNDFQKQQYSQLKEIIAKVSNVNGFPLLSNRRYNNNILSRNGDEEEENQVSFEPFKYRDQYDLSQLKSILIKKIEEDYITYSQDDMEDLINVINSNLFVRVLNDLKLNEILEIEKEPEIILFVLAEKIKEKAKAIEGSNSEDAFDYDFDDEKQANEEEEEKEEGEDSPDIIMSLKKQGTKTFSKLNIYDSEENKKESVFTQQDNKTSDNKKEVECSNNTNINNANEQKEIEDNNTIFNPAVVNEINNTTTLHNFDTNNEEIREDPKEFLPSSRVNERYPESEDDSEENEEENDSQDNNKEDQVKPFELLSQKNEEGEDEEEFYNPESLIDNLISQ